MKKVLLIAILFACHLSLFTPAQAQSRFDVTAFAGLNMGQLDGDGAGSYNHPGLRLGLGTSFALGSDIESPWRMAVELAFTNKGSFVEAYNRSLSVNYVEIPLMLAYSCMDSRLRLAAGVAPAVQVGASVTNGGAEDKPSQDNFTSMDWLPLTASIGYRFTDHLGVEMRYQNSMVSVTKQNAQGSYRIWRKNVGSFHRLLGVGLTYRF